MSLSSHSCSAAHSSHVSLTARQLFLGRCHRVLHHCHPNTGHIGWYTTWHQSPVLNEWNESIFCYLILPIQYTVLPSWEITFIWKVLSTSHVCNESVIMTSKHLLPWEGVWTVVLTRHRMSPASSHVTSQLIKPPLNENKCACEDVSFERAEPFSQP